jgi:hypothetical protein
MEGAEGFDFFRQPDFVDDPFLKGSYAVYKKETVAGEGTGKLCHIHRPEIIDGRGRRVWGDLSVAGNRLCITIPEWWLNEATYPVIVDPTIGTTTVGSQTQWYNADNESYEQLFLELSLGVNRFLINEALTGTATAYVYAYDREYDGECKPVLYSDNGNTPKNRKSKSERNFDIAVSGSKAAGWRSTTFQARETISPGTYIWFGLFCEWFAPRFDYGAKCYMDYWDLVGDDIPDTYPLWQANSYYDFKLSMYFSYSSGQNYTRTLSQGIRLTDSRKTGGSYLRKAIQTAGAAGGTQRISQAKRTIADTGMPGTGISKKQDFRRGITHWGTVETAALRKVEYIKRLPETAGSTASAGIFRYVVIKVVEAVAALYEMKAATGFKRGIGDTAGIDSVMGGMVRFFRTLFGVVVGGDSTDSVITRMRIIQDTESATGDVGRTVDYLRGLFSEAGTMAETTRRGEYCRIQQDTAYSEAVSLRHLSVFIRLLTGAYIRDYIIGRFLKSKEKLVIKSSVCREIILESSLH